MTQDDFQFHVVEALARLDTKMTSLVGNGKPGRVDQLEDKVDNLNKWRWITAGGAGTISALIHFIFKY